MRRLFTVSALLVVVACPLTTAGSAAAPSIASRDRATTVPPTTVRVVGPLDADGRLAAGYRIAHRYGNANCESGSPTTGHAYQCFTPQSPIGIYDSCWVQADRHYVVCLTKPWLRRTDRLHVTRGYGDAPGFAKVHKPWGVRLDAPVRCLRILGPVHTINGQSRTYDCNHRKYLAGQVRRHAKSWRVHVYRLTSRGRYTSLGMQPVSIAWFGKPSSKDSAD